MNKIMVISSPRSGLNYFRWIMESLSGKPTPGCTRLIENKKNKDYLFHRTHDVKQNGKFPSGCHKVFYYKNGKTMYKKCILLLRNPLELYGCYKKIKRINTMRIMKAYIDNLKAFDNFKGQKLKINYEDLLQSTKSIIKQALKFFNIKQDITHVDFSILSKDSLRSFNTVGNNKSGSDAKSLVYYTKELSQKEIEYILNYLHKRIDDRIWKKYLRRYIR